MEQHPVIGERILANVEDYAEIASIVRHHHERVDGGGYPDALVGEQIPLLSRIIAVADAYNAMTSQRPYRDAMPSQVARLRMAQAVESQFDTAVVAAFEAVLVGATNDTEQVVIASSSSRSGATAPGQCRSWSAKPFIGRAGTPTCSRLDRAAAAPSSPLVVWIEEFIDQN